MMRPVQAVAARFAALVLLALAAGCNAPGRAPAAASTAPASPAAGLSVPGVTMPLSIRAAAGERRFRVEVARTPAEQEQGLMFRERLDPAGGMIFPFRPARPASFWMRNTVIPLDLIFIRPDGRIGRIAANATPYSLDTIDSGEPVAAVLEIAGGRAAALGIASGDVVTWGG